MPSTAAQLAARPDVIGVALGDLADTDRVVRAAVVCHPRTTPAIAVERPSGRVHCYTADPWGFPAFDRWYPTWDHLVAETPGGDIAPITRPGAIRGSTGP